VPGKADWRAHGLPVEGELAGVPTAGNLTSDDIVTCGLADPVGVIREQVEDSPYGFALVTTEDAVLLGRLSSSRCNRRPTTPPREQIRHGTGVVNRARRHPGARPCTTPGRTQPRTAIVTAPEGRLIGVVRRADLDEAVATTENAQ